MYAEMQNVVSFSELQTTESPQTKQRNPTKESRRMPNNKTIPKGGGEKESKQKCLHLSRESITLKNQKIPE